MRAKPLTLGLLAIAGAVALGAGSQPWVTFSLEAGSTEQSTGHDLNAALSPIALAIIAAALALTIAGPIFRRVLGVLITGLGVGATALAFGVVADPAAATATRVTELTGLAGHAGMDAIVGEALTVWPWVTIVAGVISALAGLFVVVTSGRWASAGRKYDTSAAQQPTGPRDRISDWEALSAGEDPTEGTDPEPEVDSTPGDARA
ncbi:putative membrane protein (TIGR02234 family) [Leucobacter exalbidus]|uniref:Membrane protein (TIGR02234 family) n=1 Tax=Leucobacter exalbidus TaxID=662960 RepID=A0A940PUG5_9MICO|nr:Trp biosynthesis-associated membrane protein [Leucobacter exalbidus]MBP1325509.1 putative membrane protein (TIGR02234 family) [Leucobacter exalbidus]